MIVIYDKTETEFKTLGLGTITDFVSNPLTTEVLNGEYYVEFEYLKKGKNAEHIVEENIVKSDGQCFRIINVKKTLSTIKILAKHIFYDLGSFFIEDVYPKERTSQGALEWILNNTESDNNFTVKGDCTTLSSARYVRKTVLEAIFKEENCILNCFGGELSYDNFDIYVHSRRGKLNGIDIRFSKNLNGIDYELDFTGIATKLMPIGKDGLLLPEKYVVSKKINNYLNPIVRKIELDVAVNDDTNDQEAYRIMRKFCNDYFASGGDTPNISIKVDFIELSKTIEYKKYANLESIHLGDECRVFVPGINIDISARVVKTVKDNVLDRIISAEIGNVRADFVSSSTKENTIINNQLQDVNKDSILAEARKNASDMIKHPFGGHLYLDEYSGAIYIMDTNDPLTAENVWCWSLGGFGFSSTGINGTYETAITQDGSIVADFISTGKLQTNVIEGWDNLILKVDSIEEEIKNIDTSLYHAEISNDGTSITRDISTVTLTAKLMNASSEVTTSATSFNWKRVSSDTTADTTWNNAHKGRKSVVITSDDLDKNANFYCNVTAPEWSGKTSSVTINDETKIPQLSSSFLDVTGVQLVQTLNTDGTYSPSWTQMKPVITPSVIDGVLDVPLSECTIEYKRVVNGVEQALISGETVTNGILTISKNVMSKTQSSITYISYITYKEVSIKLFASFSLNVIGKDGTDGVDGIDGLNGKDGSQGIAGKDGADGKTSYTHIAYSNSADGKIDFSVSDSNRIYMGMYVDFVATDSTDYTKYAWSKIKGADGTQGIPGTKGADGKTPYLHIAYANNSTGTSGFSTTDSTNKTYIGNYTDYISADSTDPTKYSWTKTKGETGTQGIGIKSVLDEYYVSTSKIDPVGGSWSSAKPIWSTGKYLWKRTKNTKTDNSVTYTTAYCDNSWEAVNDLEIGGRNLIATTSDQEIILGGYPTTGYLEGKTYKTTMTLLGDEYILSFDAKSTINNDRIICHFYNPNTIISCETSTGYRGTVEDGRAEVKLTNQWVRYWIKYKMQPNTDTKQKSIIIGRRTPTFGTGTISIMSPKLDKGNKNTDYTPAPEDQKQDLIDTEVRITESYNSAIEETNKNIRLFVSESIEATGDWQSALTSLRNEVVLTKDATEFLKTSSQVIKDLQSGKVDINEIKEWARFDGATLELGASNSQYKTKLTTTELSFYQGNTKVAWISNNELHVTSISAKKSIKTGTFIFEDEGAYGFTFKKAGG